VTLAAESPQLGIVYHPPGSLDSREHGAPG